MTCRLVITVRNLDLFLIYEFFYLTVRLDRNSLRGVEGKEGISNNLSLFGLINITRKSKSRNDCDPFNSLQIFNFSSFRRDLEGRVNHPNKERISDIPFLHFLLFSFPYKYNPNIL